MKTTAVTAVPAPWNQLAWSYRSPSRFNSPFVAESTPSISE